MIMITAIITMMVTAIISTVARYVAWQLSIAGHPLYSFIIWHIFLLTIVYAIFYDSRQGFKKSIKILSYFSNIYHSSNRKGKVNATMYMYREHSKKFQPKSILLPVAITILVAYALSSQLIFFAIVTSGSMQPTFKKGDLVFMQNVLVKPEVGDVIIFPDPEGYVVSDKPVTVTHRIIEINGDIIRTKGDHNPTMDGWVVKKSSILGKAVIINDKPFILEDVGKYFLLDYKSQEYTNEFLGIAKTIQNIRSFGIMIFFICIALYLYLSIKDSRPSRSYRSDGLKRYK